MNAASGPDVPWPNLFIVGAAHAGTTTLWRNLGRHPEIWMARVKEPNFFSGVEWPLNEDVHDESVYLRLFAGGAECRYRGEASCSYLWSAEVPARIKSVSPAARIVISLRDPVERTHSSYWYSVRIGVERRPFSEAIRGEIDQGAANLLGGSRYPRNVERYLETFPGAVQVLFLEDLAKDPEGVLGGTFDFLGLDPGPATPLSGVTHNPRALPRNPVAAAVNNSPRIRAALRKIAPVGLRPRAQRLLMKRAESEPIDPRTDAELTELLAPDVERLESLLGREAPWPRFREAGK